MPMDGRWLTVNGRTGENGEIEERVCEEEREERRRIKKKRWREE